MSFIDLEKAYNKETLWQVMRMYDASCKLLNRINSMYVNSLDCRRIKGYESECLKIDNVISCPLGSSMYIGME